MITVPRPETSYLPRVLIELDKQMKEMLDFPVALTVCRYEEVTNPTYSDC